MAFAELQGLPVWRVHLLGVLLLAGRVIHAVAVLREPEPIRLRVAGMILTLAALIGGGTINLDSD
jgi:uncharacterized membrane protein YecN with MAPEG domain